MSYKLQFQKHECKYCMTCYLCHNCLKNRASIFRKNDSGSEESDMFEHSACYHFNDIDPQYIIVGPNNEKIVTTPDRLTLSVIKYEELDDSMADENIIVGPDNKKINVTPNAVTLAVSKPELHESGDDSIEDDNRIDECAPDENRSNAPISKNSLQKQIKKTKFNVRKPIKKPKYNLPKQMKKPYNFERLINELNLHKQIAESSESEPVSNSNLQIQIEKPYDFQRLINEQNLQEQIDESSEDEISKSNLQKQIAESSEEDELISLDCSVCNKTFSNKRDLEIHLIYHSTEEVHKCKVCGMLFEYSYELIKHSLNHKNPNNVCEFCKKEFKTAEKLRVHVASHTGEFPFSCVVCDRGFKDYPKLKSHLLCHTEDKPFLCDKCGKGFRRKSQLRTHSWVHSEVKPFSCQFCEKPFNYKCNLRLHVQRAHMNYDPNDGLEI